MLSFLWCRIFISDKECLRPRNMKLLLGFVCLFWVFLCLLAACEFFVTFFKLKKKKGLVFFSKKRLWNEVQFSVYCFRKHHEHSEAFKLHR